MKVLIGPNIMGLEKRIPDLKKAHPAVDFAFCAGEKDLPRAIADADVYFGWLNRDAFLAAGKLAWVQSPSTGVNNYVAIPELRDGNVVLTSARGTHAACVAESALAMILAFTRGIRESVRLQALHRWSQKEVRANLLELTGLTLGIVGLGSIGRALARRAAGFDMRIVAVDLFPKDRPGHVQELWGADGLDRLLAEADIVVVTVPWTPDTRGMIDAARIARMKQSAMLVGVSRGGVIDEEALANALRGNRIACAALDVFDTEPLPADSGLWELPNLLVAPHLAGGTQHEVDRLLEIFTGNLALFASGKSPLRNQADKRLGF